jgi:hypothetical protein
MVRPSIWLTPTNRKDIASASVPPIAMPTVKTIATPATELGGRIRKKHSEES